MPIFLLLVAVTFEVVADILFKQWAIANKTAFLLIGFALYSIGTLFWAYSLQFQQLSKSIIVFTLLNLIAVLLAGVLVFQEKLSFINIIGILLGLVSIILLEL